MTAQDEPWWVHEGRARELFRADRPDGARWADLTPEQRWDYRARAAAELEAGSQPPPP